MCTENYWQGVAYSLEAVTWEIAQVLMEGRIAQGHLGVAGGSPLESLQ